MKKKILLLISVCVLPGCATYYENHIEFNRHFINGEIEHAETILDRDKPSEKSKNRLLYYLDKGVVLHMQHRYAASNDYFEKAYQYVLKYRKNAAMEIASFFSNPKITDYRPEDFESVLIHYYKAINFIETREYQNALVECRRINNKLKAMNTRYAKYKNRYASDAFAWNLMGMVFEASGELNDAFIAYRNAFETYDELYADQFGISPPQQLKYDLLRITKKLGFFDEYEFYKNLFAMDVETMDHSGSRELIVLVNNGLGPVKDEWSINFYIVRGAGGTIVFENDDMGLVFPFFSSGGDPSDDLGDLRFIRVAFPKYIERPPLYDGGYLESNGQKYQLEIAEDINLIALKTLEDRMIREMAQALLRLAVKQVSEKAIREADDNLGALISIVNAISEQADTRNWQTLPYNILYARVPIDAQQQSIQLVLTSEKGYPEKSGNLDIGDEQSTIIFRTIHNIESAPLRSW